MRPKERLWRAVPIPGSHAADRKYSRLPKKTPTKRSCDDNLSCFWMVGYSGVGSHPLRMTPTLSASGGLSLPGVRYGDWASGSMPIRSFTAQRNFCLHPR